MQVIKPLNFVYMLGSLRKGSLNAIVGRELNGLAPDGVEVTALESVANVPHYNADLQAEGFPLPVLKMGEQIKNSDALIIVTPEYNYSIPGALKNALDWISRLPDAPLAGKPIAIQTASPGAIGGARAQYHLRQTMVFMEGQVLNKPEVIIGLAAQKIDSGSGVIKDQETRDIIARQLQALAQMATF
ncbi:NAD(P)H-dependent oxidoreductase (plasmid) [Pseudomonas luteola]|uniref:NADPH-dependent FMN reductase n=1 Tax=Pseudomonas luteola TaxID=47886 RepID=UPI00388E72F4